MNKFLNHFKRITSSGNYIPEIDGLRFIAIFMVAVLFHTYGNIHDASPTNNKYFLIFLNLLASGGAFGVPLFFIISGFILSIPFAKEKLLGGERVVIKYYFLRRLTRIEPLYVVTLLLYFCLRVWYYHYQSFTELLPHLGASLLYIHNFIYRGFPLINGVTWSLEIEVQFYILAPLLTNIFFVKNKFIRRFILSIIIIAGSLFPVFSCVNHLGSFIDYAPLFFAGILLADIYLTDLKICNDKLYFMLALFLLIGVLIFPSNPHSISYLLRTLFAIGFFYLALANNLIKKYLSKKIITTIGGMSYSIYLLHQGAYGAVKHYLDKISFTDILWLNAFFGLCIILFVMLLVSSFFFILIEKPTMHRNWYRKKSFLPERN